MTFYQDLLERVIRTFAVAALISFAAAVTGIVDFGSGAEWKAAAAAAAMAGGTAVLALLTKNIGPNTDTPSVF